MTCLNDYDYEVLLQHITYDKADAFIREKYWETYYFEPGYRVLGLRLLGESAVPVAVEDDATLVFPYTKPCMGTFVLRFGDVPDEVKRVRSSYSKSLTLKRWTGTGEKGKRPEAVAVTCPLDVSLRNFDYDILSHYRTLRECEKYIREKYRETYYFGPDFKVLGLKPLGKDYVPVAVEEGHDNVVFPFYDSGMGALVIRIKNVPDEVGRIRETYPRELTARMLQEPVGGTTAAASGASKAKSRGVVGQILQRFKDDQDKPPAQSNFHEGE